MKGHCGESQLRKLKAHQISTYIYIYICIYILDYIGIFGNTTRSSAVFEQSIHLVSTKVSCDFLSSCYRLHPFGHPSPNPSAMHRMYPTYSNLHFSHPIHRDDLSLHCSIPQRIIAVIAVDSCNYMILYDIICSYPNVFLGIAQILQFLLVRFATSTCKQISCDFCADMLQWRPTRSCLAAPAPVAKGHNSA